MTIIPTEPPKKTIAKKFTYFIGIDVSKNELDYAVIQGETFLFHLEGKNSPADILLFVGELKKLPKFTISKALFCMEATGFYCNHLLNNLCKLKANIWLENALQIKKSLGLVRGKNDKDDSVRIAAYAQKNYREAKLWSPGRPVVLELKQLVALRSRMLNLSMAIRTPLKEQTSFVKKTLVKQNKQLCKHSSEAVLADLLKIESRIEMVINADPNLKRLKYLITSVPCVGPVTAVQIICSTNEFTVIRDPKKFACYAGVAPFKTESGVISGRARVSHYANKRIKSLLHICAMNASRHDEELRLYYDRKTKADGKHQMSVINAIRYKLILRVFACVNQNRPYSKNFERGRRLNELPVDLNAN